MSQDTFVFEGEELVPISDGTYRLRNEASFRRFNRMASVVDGPIDSWLIEDRDGIKHWLGRYEGDASRGDSRVINPFPPQDRFGVRSPFESTFAWLEDATEDLNGNRIEYTYSRSDKESNGILFLAEIRYFARGEGANYHRVLFFYEDRSDVLDDNRGGFNRRIASRRREIAVESIYQGVEHHIRSIFARLRSARGCNCS